MEGKHMKYHRMTRRELLAECRRVGLKIASRRVSDRAIAGLLIANDPEVAEEIRLHSQSPVKAKGCNAVAKLFRF